MNNNVFIPPLKPHQPAPYKKGCSQQKEYDELTVYEDKHKFPAITTYCDYVDKKSKFVEKYLLRVKWISWEEYWLGLCEKEPLPLERFKELYECKFDPVIDEDITKEFNNRQKEREDEYELKAVFMSNRSQWMEGLLWAEERIQRNTVKTLVAEIDQLKWELLYSGVYGSVYDEDFVVGALDYLENVEARNG